MSRLHLPSIKLNISHLSQFTLVETQPLPVWNGCINGKQIKQSVVWVQGTILQEQGGVILLDDDTGTAKVHCSAAKPPPKDLSKGCYIMVIGEMVDNSSVPVIKATKVQNIYSADKSVWKYEVEDLHKYGLVH